MIVRLAPVGAFVIGVLLIVTSYVWSQPVWTDEDEAAYSAATAQWRAIGHSHGPQEEIAAQEAAKITDEYERQKAKFKSSSNRGSTMASVMWGGGLLLAFAGGAGVFVLHLMDDEG